jgi:hypothetical protein
VNRQLNQAAFNQLKMLQLRVNQGILLNCDVQKDGNELRMWKNLTTFCPWGSVRLGVGLSAPPSASSCGYYPADAALLAAAFGRPNLPKARSNQPEWSELASKRMPRLSIGGSYETFIRLSAVSR